MSMNSPFSLNRRTLGGLLAGSLLSPGLSALAQPAYPDKPIKIVIGYPPGGSVDYVGRLVGDALGQRLKTPVVIDNQGGAAGAIAAQRVVSSPADGYTLLVGSSNELVATRLVNPAQRYDAQKDMTPLGLIATAPVLLVAGPRAAVKTLPELIELARRKPGQLSYGSSGVGSTLHFAGELLKQRAGIFMTHIPYLGVASLTSDLAGGNLDLAMLSVPAALPFLQSGRITALGCTGAQRLSALPKVPTIGEVPGLKGYELSGWFALMGPAHLPPTITQRLSQALQEVLRDPGVRRKLEEGGNVLGNGHEDLSVLMARESRQYAGLVEYAHMRD